MSNTQLEIDNIVATSGCLTNLVATSGSINLASINVNSIVNSTNLYLWSNFR